MASSQDKEFHMLDLEKCAGCGHINLDHHPGSGPCEHFQRLNNYPCRCAQYREPEKPTDGE